MIDLNLNPSKKELRLFAVLQVVFFAVLSFLLWRRGSISPSTIIGIIGTSATVGATGFVFVPLMRVVYIGWMIAVFPIGWAISHAVMAIVYFAVFMPVGWIIKISGRDSIRRRFDRDAKTYWRPRNGKIETKRYFRQY